MVESQVCLDEATVVERAACFNGATSDRVNTQYVWTEITVVGVPRNKQAHSWVLCNKETVAVDCGHDPRVIEDVTLTARSKNVVPAYVMMIGFCNDFTGWSVSWMTKFLLRRAEGVAFGEHALVKLLKAVPITAELDVLPDQNPGRVNQTTFDLGNVRLVVAGNVADAPACARPYFPQLGTKLHTRRALRRPERADISLTHQNSSLVGIAGRVGRPP